MHPRLLAWHDRVRLVSKKPLFEKSGAKTFLNLETGVWGHQAAKIAGYTLGLYSIKISPI
jgi:hypothetical protein